MKPNEYTKQALKTDVDDYSPAAQRLRTIPRGLHAAMGMVTESSEVLDLYKKYMAYGKQYDKAKLIDEIGDCLWYIAIALDDLDSSFESAMQLNINKLRTRFGDKFTEHKAINRNIDNENKVFSKLKGNTTNGQKKEQRRSRTAARTKNKGIKKSK